MCEKGRPSKRYPDVERQLRCGCGNLMARVTTSGIELKCRRCKRICIVPLGRADIEKLCLGKQILNQKGQRPLSPESEKEREDEKDSGAASKV